MLSILSAIFAGILAMVQIVNIFGHILPGDPPLHLYLRRWGPDSVVVLLAVAVVLGLAIHSSCLACLAPEDNVWTTTLIYLNHKFYNIFFSFPNFRL